MLKKFYCCSIYDIIFSLQLIAQVRYGSVVSNLNCASCTVHLCSGSELLFLVPITAHLICALFFSCIIAVILGTRMAAYVVHVKYVLNWLLGANLRNIMLDAWHIIKHHLLMELLVFVERPAG